MYPTSLSLHRVPAAGNAVGHVQLLAGLSDGVLVTYDLSASAGENGKLVVLNRKASRLGQAPLRLEAVHSSVEGAAEEQGERILALGLSERMSVIFESKGRVDFSSVSKRVRPFPI